MSSVSAPVLLDQRFALTLSSIVIPATWRRDWIALRREPWSARMRLLSRAQVPIQKQRENNRYEAGNFRRACRGQADHI